MANCITRHIPNFITCCNLFSGCIASVMAFQANYEAAILFIILGATFDFFDGMLARLFKVLWERNWTHWQTISPLVLPLRPLSSLCSKKYNIQNSCKPLLTIFRILLLSLLPFLHFVWGNSTSTHAKAVRSSDCRPLPTLCFGAHWS